MSSESQAWKRLGVQVLVTMALSAGSAAVGVAYAAGRFEEGLEALDNRVKLLERNDDGKGIVLTDHTSQLTGLQSRISSNSALIQTTKTDLKGDLRDLKADINSRLDTIITFLQRENDLRK